MCHIIHLFFLDAHEESLYESFINCICEYLGSNPKRVKNGTTSEIETQPVLPYALDSQLHLKGTNDPLLNTNFLSIFHPEGIKPTLFLSKEEELERLRFYKTELFIITYFDSP